MNALLPSNMTASAAAGIRTCHVEDQKENLRIQLQALTEAVSLLEVRVAPVVRQVRQEPCSDHKAQGMATPEEVLVPLAAEMRERNKEVAMLNQRIGSLLSRLELP